LNDILTEIIDALAQLKRMHQLNLELLEQLDVICGWLLKNKIPIPDQDHFCSLLTKAQTLLKEIYSDSPAFLQHQKRKPTDKFTEPVNVTLNS